MAQKQGYHLTIGRSRKFILSEETPFIITEAYKTARTNLVFSLASCKNKIVVVTSCLAAEGKSTNCLNLAITMAQMGASVLLIDADMRKPVQHLLMEIENKVGLSSFLGGITDDVRQAICANARPGLDVLTSGPIPPNPAELLSSRKMEQLLELVSKHYDYVFIDTPPVTVVSDAFLMNEHTAGMIFIIKEGYTTHTAVNMALEQIKMTNGKVLGFIKTNCNSKGKRDYKSYKYQYKYSHRDDDKEQPKKKAKSGINTSAADNAAAGQQEA